MSLLFIYTKWPPKANIETDAWDKCHTVIIDLLSNMYVYNSGK